MGPSRALLIYMGFKGGPAATTTTTISTTILTITIVIIIIISTIIIIIIIPFWALVIHIRFKWAPAGPW